MQKKLPISVCLISSSEADRIRRALESVAPWTSEIIVVLNAEVRDGTEEIARACGATVVREPWKGFVKQKNSAQEKASQPWVLNLDADEAVSPELREEIFHCFASGPERYCAYSFPRRSFYLGRWIRHGEWYPDRCVRLWQRGRAKWAGTDPHAVLRVVGDTGRFRHDLLHYNCDTIDRQIAKTVKYADDFAQACQTQGRHVGLVDLLIRPPWRFFRSFVLRLGFLDGWQGFSIAWMTAFYTFLRYFKALEVQARRVGFRDRTSELCADACTPPKP